MSMASRVHSWLTSAWGERYENPAADKSVAQAPDIEAIRQAMRMVVAPCSDAHRARATGQIARAGSVTELWLLRSSLYQYLAQDLGQTAASQRVAALLPLFKGAVPGVAVRRQFADNDAHAKRLH